MSDGYDAVPFDDADLDEGAGPVGVDEHRYLIVLHEVAHRISKGVKHSFIGDTVTVCAGEDERLLLYAFNLQIASNLV